MSSSLWGIANPGAGAGGSVMYGGALGSPPSVWTPALGEMVLKIDGKFKVRVPPEYLIDVQDFMFLVRKSRQRC